MGRVGLRYYQCSRGECPRAASLSPERGQYPRGQGGERLAHAPRHWIMGTNKHRRQPPAAPVQQAKEMATARKNKKRDGRPLPWC